MDQIQYRNGILAAYEGEVLGMAMFAVLRRRLGTSPDRAARLDRLVALEQATMTRLAPVLDRHGLAVADCDDHRRKGQAWADQLSDWPALLHALRDGTEDYIATFDQLHAAAEPADREALQQLADHEWALWAFARAELANDPERALRLLDDAIAGVAAARER